MDYYNNIMIDYSLIGKEELPDNKWKEIYIGFDSQGKKYQKTLIKQIDKKIIKKEGEREYFSDSTFRIWTDKGYSYRRLMTPEEVKQKRINERKNWKPFGEYGGFAKKIEQEVYIEFTNATISNLPNKDIESLQNVISYSEEYTPPTLSTLTNKATENSSNDEYQLPENLVSSISVRVTVVVSNIITSLSDNDLHELIREMAEENGIPTKITIPPVKFVYDRQARTEKPLPRLAFIEYPHEADAHYSIQYMDKKIVEHNIIEASLRKPNTDKN
jgi:hypothetical protein